MRAAFGAQMCFCSTATPPTLPYDHTYKPSSNHHLQYHHVGLQPISLLSHDPFPLLPLRSDDLRANLAYWLFVALARERDRWAEIGYVYSDWIVEQFEGPGFTLAQRVVVFWATLMLNEVAEQRDLFGAASSWAAREYGAAITKWASESEQQLPAPAPAPHYTTAAPPLLLHTRSGPAGYFVTSIAVRASALERVQDPASGDETKDKRKARRRHETERKSEIDK
ncbi:hypothetical protein DE146DRAFT_635657 [Phaeosphaeria sp. MPI-PUGE-AT-0046c]|nr:hypothetical protein DE146DRAFT_635657 [Phaeosphaeria sp. MPI-PUGE-AT-0046c]